MRALLLAIACGKMAQAQEAAVGARLGRMVYRSHFRPNPGASPSSGSRDGWESFPIAQEAGYDPTLYPETINGESALVRESAPLEDGPFQLGFIRRVHLVMGAGSSVRLRVRVPYATGATPVRLYLYRGAKEESHTCMIHSSGWQEIAFPIVASPEALTTIAVEAEFSHAVHGRVERFLMEDVRIAALGARRIELNESTAFWDASRELYYFRRSFHPGDELLVQAGLVPRGTTWTLTAPGGLQMARGDGGEVHYRLAVDAAVGVWQLRLSNKRAQATALLLVQPLRHRGVVFDQPPAISKELLEAIRERRVLLEETAHPETGKNIPTMDSHWLLPGLTSYFSILLQSPELAMLDAIEFRATGDTTALARSLRILDSVAEWPMWVHPWFPAHGYHSYYPVGIMTKYVVMAEQFLGNNLPEVERQRLDRSLMELSVKPVYEEYVLEDRLQFNTSNWIGNTVGGALLAALQSDDADAAGYALGLFTKDREHVRAAYTADGSYGEGVSYQRFDLEMTTLVAEAAKRLLGESLDGMTADGERYMKYAAYGEDGLMDFGDSHVDLRPSNVFAYQAALNQSASLTDFYFRYREEGTTELLSRVLWEGKIRRAEVPVAAEPASRIFEERGVAVLRDGWDRNATVLAMRAGKNFNHNHADQGSLFLAQGGKQWIGEAGYADYYKDPSYPTFNMQAAGHNTLLVDGDPESQVLPGNEVFGTAPSMKHSLMGEKTSLVEADLTSAYGGKLERYTRTVFFAPGGTVVVIDEVKAKAPHIFTEVWHPKQSAVSFDGAANRFQLSDGTLRLDVQAFADERLETTERESPLPLVDYERAEHELVKKPLRFETSTLKAHSSATILTVFRPATAGEKVLSQAQWKVDGNELQMDGSGVRIGTEGEGRPVLAWWDGGAMLLHGLRYEDAMNETSISASHPVDMEVVRAGTGEIRVEVNAEQRTELRFKGLRLAAGNACPGCESDSSTVSLSAGHTVLRLLMTQP